MSNTPFHEIAAERYIVLTTTKKNGESVPTPVWIAELADGSLGFTTDASSGKVKRIRNISDVTMQASNARGVPKSGSAVVPARATVLLGDDVASVTKSIAAKYGWQVKLIGVASILRRLFKKSDPASRAAIRLDPAA